MRNNLLRLKKKIVKENEEVLSSKMDCSKI